MRTFSDFLNEAYVNTDATKTENISSMIRGAIADEQSAINLYTEILEFAPNKETFETIKEIIEDEKNHTGKLLYLLRKLDDFESVERGMNNKEVS